MVYKHYMSNPTSFEIERAVAFLTSARLVTDIARQKADHDLELNGKSISVKFQAIAGRTGNLSVELLQEDTRTGKTIPGNFRLCTAEWVFFVVPAAAARLQVLCFKHSVIDQLLTSRRFRQVGLTPERLEANRRAGRRYDNAVSALLPLREVATAATTSFSFSYEELLKEEKFRQFLTEHPCNQKMW